MKNTSWASIPLSDALYCSRVQDSEDETELCEFKGIAVTLHEEAKYKPTITVGFVNVLHMLGIGINTIDAFSVSDFGRRMYGRA